MSRRKRTQRKFSVDKQREKVRLRDESISIVGVLYEGLIDSGSVLVSSADGSGSAYEVPSADIVNQTVVEKGVDGDIVQLDIKKEAIVIVVQIESAQRLADISARLGGRPGRIVLPGSLGVQCTCTGGCICACLTPDVSTSADAGANAGVIGHEHDMGRIGIPGGRFNNPLPGRQPGLL